MIAFMGIFSLFDSRKAAKAGSNNPNLASVPPDERPIPKWGKITHREYERDVRRHLRAKLGEHKAAIVEATIEGSIEEKGVNRDMDEGEVGEAMEVLTDEHNALHLSKKNLADTRNILDQELRKS